MTTKSCFGQIAIIGFIFIDTTDSGLQTNKRDRIIEKSG